MKYTGTLPMHSPTTIQHFGVKGQKWGRRRYQNEDGSLTAEGREHYATKTAKAEKRGETVGKALRNHPKLSKLVTGHKAYSGVRGYFRTNVGTQRKAAFIKGMKKGEGKPLTKKEFHEIQDKMAQSHRRHLMMAILNNDGNDLYYMATQIRDAKGINKIAQPDKYKQ